MSNNNNDTDESLLGKAKVGLFLLTSYLRLTVLDQ